ncbi:MAG: restriction endonuclease subunit S [Burkholderiales bacterium]
MKLERFLDNFDQFADAPNAVAKMRELVLQLAFTGGLSGKRQDEGGLPQGWEKRIIESICSSISPGFACSRSHQVDGGHVHLRTHNISTLGTLNFDLLVRIDPAKIDPQKSVIRQGDILFNNTNSQELVGKTCLVDKDYDYGFSNHITRLRLKDDVFPGFVVFYLTLLRNSGYFARLCTRWINQAAVNTETLKKQIIPIPPLAEQKRIVAKVNELMALCDRLEAQQQERDTRHAALARASLARFAEAPTPANLDFLFHKSYTITPADLRKSILTLAVQGKLVPQDPNDESAYTLLARIKNRGVKDNGRRKKSQPDIAVTLDDIPFEIPSGWAWERLGNIGETNIGLTYSPQDVSDVGIPVLRSSNIQNGELDFDDLVRVKCEPKQSVMVQDGDLLICARNGSRALVGKVAVIKDLKEPAAFGAFMAIYRSELNQYLYHFIRSPLFRQMIDEVNTTTINQITQNNLRSTLAPIPPLAEQHRIVAKVDELIALVDQLETQLAASRATAAKLMEAVVAELTSHSGFHTAIVEQQKTAVSASSL